MSEDLPLFSLSELEEIERSNGQEFTDIYTLAYMENLRAGMPQILAHFEAVIVREGGDDNIHPNFLEHVKRHREHYQRSLS